MFFDKCIPVARPENVRGHQRNPKLQRSTDPTEPLATYMKIPTSARHIKICLLSATIFGLLTGFGKNTLQAAGGRAHGAKPEKYLYIWAGDEKRVHPDFLTVVDFDEHSSNYGRVIATADAPTSGNEPHHCHISSDGNVILCGGLLSLLEGQDSIFYFDISKPKKPEFISSTRAQLSSITDDPYPLANGGYLITQMGSAAGGAPGRLAEFDRNRQLVHEWPDNVPQDGFNPHGISVRPEINLMITSDFLNPVTTLNAYSGPLEVRGAIRVWDLAKRTIVDTITIPPAVGTMECHLIPDDPNLGAYTGGMFDQGGAHLYYLDLKARTFTKAFDVDSLLPGGMPQIFELSEDGTKLVVSISAFPTTGPSQGMVALLDITDRTHVRVLSFVDLGPGSAPHDLLLTEDNKRVVVSDYFVNEDDFGKIHFDGDHKVHVLKIEGDKLSLDPSFQLDFNTAFPGIRARPHGLDAK